MTRKPKPSARGRVSRPGSADLARGANGLGEEAGGFGADAEVERAAKGMIDAQMRMMTTLMQSSADMTVTGMKAFTAFWTMGMPGADKTDKKRRK